MRNIIMAFILGTAFTNSLLSGVESVNDGGVSWVFLLIVFPLAALAGLVALLLEHRKKRAPAESRRPDSPNTDQQPEQPR
ncbi:hypothetical protein [Brevibacterium sp. UCMA 11752]|uniref:hypothetical protein n=1 Tax=Brevibacterium sp. UCMA 11752 TaxID=2745946 RepID=UPI001F2A084F|nr:hypothetical protein [Brevibacterium sp. UCMA 11752]MCF2589014.1 hypothetical protein [Brevibacterium sp. UCMA 11752]